MDFDYSGTIEQDEYDRCQSMTGIGALDSGAISNPEFDDGPWSCAGYDGYIYDDIADLSCVRFRWYDAGLGRWMTRDPEQYVDGMNVLSFVGGRPTTSFDPLGLYGCAATGALCYVRCAAGPCDFWAAALSAIGDDLHAQYSALIAYFGVPGGPLSYGAGSAHADVRACGPSDQLFMYAFSRTVTMRDAAVRELKDQLAAYNELAALVHDECPNSWVRTISLKWTPGLKSAAPSSLDDVYYVRAQDRMDSGVCQTDLVPLSLLGIGPAAQCTKAAAGLALERLPRRYVHMSTLDGLDGIIGSGCIRRDSWIGIFREARRLTRTERMEHYGIDYAKTECQLTFWATPRQMRLDAKQGLYVQAITVHGRLGASVRAGGGAKQWHNLQAIPKERCSLWIPRFYD